MGENSKNIENEYIKKLQDYAKKYKNDNEELHIYCDETLLSFLEQIGYNKIVEEYKQIKNENLFWYA